MSNTLNLENKVALITGGTTGIGLASAKKFLDAGATVVVTGRNPDTLKAAEQELGDRVTVLKSDAGDPADIEALFAKVKSLHGGIDVLFLNAGIAQFAPLEHVDAEFIQRTFAVNVVGPLLAVKHAKPLLNEGASVILNTSVVNQKGMPATSVYAASKAALRSLTRTLAAELVESGARVNAVAPGPIETPIYGKLGMPKAELDAFAGNVVSQVPLARFGRPEEVADAALFLATSRASYINGVELAVDGGMTQL